MTDRNAGSVWAGGLILAVLAAICTALVAITHSTTAPQIAANEQAYLEARLRPVLGGIEYDGKLSESTIVIPPPHELPGNTGVTVYRVYGDGRPIAALFVVTAMDGFSGAIRMLVGVDADGVLTGVRVLDHRETPGLGDLIEESKSDWILQFGGKSLNNPAREMWAIKRDGGTFDQFSGASITPRAVVGAVRDTLLYFEKHRDRVFAPGVTGDE
jgi:electron transport complex protein RnfG